ncbi:hypothetical protein Q5762_38145, partial [Streptomyces sp. P9(2023)]|uniref:hypothetical protein n=1 Tax=Streptomyces sp. P9(2023) TaxID=3064394 RepID=UPI0028F43138
LLSLQDGAQALAEIGSVRQVGQRVVVRHVGDPRFDGAPLSDVLGDPEQVLRPSRLIRDGQLLDVEEAFSVGGCVDLALFDESAAIRR